MGNLSLAKCKEQSTVDELLMCLKGLYGKNQPIGHLKKDKDLAY